MREMNVKLKTCLVMGLAAWAALAPAVLGQADDAYQAIVKREYGTAIAEMTAIEKGIQNAKPEEYPQIEAKLLAVLEAPEATMPGKQFVCQMLKIVGSSKCIPAVSKLLMDEQLSHSARNVFLGMRDPAADVALRTALGKTQGKVRIGIINTIGDRQDRQALTALVALLNADEATGRAVLNAIGKIGGAARGRRRLRRRGRRLICAAPGVLMPRGPRQWTRRCSMEIIRCRCAPARLPPWCSCRRSGRCR
jgi:hypothetical protein